MTALSLALALFPDLDGLDDLIEDSALLLFAWLSSIGCLAAFVVVHAIADRLAHRSPVDRMLRRRFR